MILEGIEMAEEKKGDPNLVQFRRYAEAALSGLISDRKEFDSDRYMARRAFEIAIAMMTEEINAFEAFQLIALERVVAKQRSKHGIEEPSERSKVF
jgi:hypothetical protein